MSVSVVFCVHIKIICSRFNQYKNILKSISSDQLRRPCLRSWVRAFARFFYYCIFYQKEYCGYSYSDLRRSNCEKFPKSLCSIFLIRHFCWIALSSIHICLGAFDYSHALLCFCRTFWFLGIS